MLIECCWYDGLENGYARNGFSEPAAQSHIYIHIYVNVRRSAESSCDNVPNVFVVNEGKSKIRLGATIT